MAYADIQATFVLIMAGLRAEELSTRIERARRLAERYMPSSCEVIRTPRVPDGMGGYTDGTPTVVSRHKCRLRRVSGNESVLAGQLAQDVTGTLLLPYGADVRSTDSVRVDGRDYEVAAVLRESADYQAQLEVLVAGRE